MENSMLINFLECLHINRLSGITTASFFSGCHREKQDQHILQKSP